MDSARDLVAEGRGAISALLEGGGDEVARGLFIIISDDSSCNSKLDGVSSLGRVVGRALVVDGGAIDGVLSRGGLGFVGRMGAIILIGMRFAGMSNLDRGMRASGKGLIRCSTSRR